MQIPQTTANSTHITGGLPFNSQLWNKCLGDSKWATWRWFSVCVWWDGGVGVRAQLKHRSRDKYITPLLRHPINKHGEVIGGCVCACV